MQRTFGSIIAVVLSLTLTACISYHPDAGSVAVGSDGVACIGGIQKPPGSEATETVDPALLGQAVAASGKGGVCTGKVFAVQKPVRAYRVWDSSKSYTQMGRWWAFDKPQGPRDKYRHEYAICPTWSALDHLVSCDIKPGTAIVIGTTQSADCDDGVYPKTAFNQVYIPNNASANVVLVENCRDEGAWPAATATP